MYKVNTESIEQESTFRGSTYIRVMICSYFLGERASQRVVKREEEAIFRDQGKERNYREKLK